MFLRFVVGTPRENPYWLTGLFTAARELRDDGRLEPHEAEWLGDVYDWFSNHLPCPPFRRNLDERSWSAIAVCWFKDAAGEPLNRMWDFVALLTAHDRAVRFIHTDRPGRVVYEDQFQIVAETPRLNEQDPRLMPRRLRRMRRR